MSEKVYIPLEISRNPNLSARAKIVWAELTLLPQGQVGEFPVKQKEMASLMGIHVSTLRRALKRLLENGLIQYVGLFEKRFKKYVFVSCHSKLDLESSHDANTLDVVADVPRKNEENPPSPLLLRGNSYTAAFIAKGGLEPTHPKYEHYFPYAERMLFYCGPQWKGQFPRLNGNEGRPSITPELVTNLMCQWDELDTSESSLVFFALQFKILSGEKIKPLPNLSSQEFLSAIEKQEQKILNSLGEEKGWEMIEGLIKEWGYFDYQERKRDPRTRPGIARAIAAI